MTFTLTNTVTVIGAPLGIGQPLLGVELGPAVIRMTGVLDKVAKLGWEVDDIGDLEFPYQTDPSFVRHHPSNSELREGENAYDARQVGESCLVIYNTATMAHLKNNFVLTLGGNHAASIGSVQASLAQHPDTLVIWVDAHCDINTPRTSGSGNIHGMPVAIMMGLVDPTLTGHEWLREFDYAPLRSISVGYIGLRAVDPGEKSIVKEAGVKAWDMRAVTKDGIGRVVENLLSTLDPEGNRPIHLSFDIDAIDPREAPATGCCEPRGLTGREGEYICQALAETGRLCSMDMMEINPALTPNDHTTAELASSLIQAALGDRQI